MERLLFWLYLINATLLIVHEMDSTFWREWELFKLPGGVGGFLLLHIPLLAVMLYGLVLVHEQAFAGMIFSLILAGAGIFAFSIHIYFIRRGHPQFRTRVSQAILVGTLAASLTQGIAILIIL